jgi:hypothetical protein
MTDINYEELAKALITTMKTASSTPTFQSGHGPGGPFSTAGVNRNVFNAGVVPQGGLFDILPHYKSVDINPLHMITTGVTATSGSQPAGDCDPCKVPGNLKRGIIKSTFGRFCLSTKTINVSDIGGVNNRGEMTDLRWIGDPFGGNAGTVAPSVFGSNGNPLQSELAKAMYEFKVGWVREFSKQLYSGNPSNNSGSYKEYRGLDILVNTGYQDAETGALLPAADSLVRNINLNMSANGTTYVNEFTYALRRQKHAASRMGLAPVRFAFVMTEMAFYELTSIWPCSYNIYRCATNADGATVNLEATDQRRMVEDMRNGKYLLVDGERVPVVTDDSIAETGTSEFTSTVYLLPLTVQGGIASLYIEYFDFDNGNSAEIRSAFNKAGKYTTTDAGRFIWAVRENGFCVSYDAVERSRVILETPWLAVRFTNVKYTPLMSTKSGYSTDGARFYNGGSTSVTAPSFYAPTVYSN